MTKSPSPPGAQVLPVAPTLSSPEASSTGPTTAALSVTTDQSGMLYAILSLSATEPSEAQIMAGQDASGAAAAWAGAESVLIPGVESITATGLIDGTAYFAFFMQANSRFLSSNIAAAASFTSGAGAILGEDGSYILAEDGSHIAMEN